MSDLKKKKKLQTKEQQVDETPSILLAFINACPICDAMKILPGRECNELLS